MECILCWIAKNEIFGRRHFKKSFFVTSLSILIWKIYLWKCSKQSAKAVSSKSSTQDDQQELKLKDTMNIREVLFFRNDGTACFEPLKLVDKEHMLDCQLERYCPVRNLLVIHKYLKSASVSIDVCLLHLTMRCVEQIIIKAHSNGIRVRIISDDEMYQQKSRIPWLEKKGVPVKIKRRHPFQMHNKFVIVDKKVLMTGSLNWTGQGFCGNWENLMMTSEPYLVHKYLQEFENLWALF